MTIAIPDFIPNQINGQDCPAQGGQTFEKYNPATGALLTNVAASQREDVEAAVRAARDAQAGWAATPPVQRGMILHKIVDALLANQESMASIVALETGKSPAEAAGETGGAAQLGLFFASEGQRLYGKTTTSGQPHRQAMTVRMPRGVAGLIIAANTPIANVAWKVFPALVCGNSVVLKAAEDTPATAWYFAQLAREAGLPDGVLNVIQGLGTEAGQPLVEHEDVDVISFTGSSRVGRLLNEIAARRMARISLELGGKNALVVCDDADIDQAVKWIVLSSFSNAGQRCAAAGRILVFEYIYETVKERLLKAVEKLKVGPGNEHDFGPVINERQLHNMLDQLREAERRGGKILAGGQRLEGNDHGGGYYLAPTVIEGLDNSDPLAGIELFGPIAMLIPVRDFQEALDITNDSPYGLTAAIHTRDVDRALCFAHQVDTGVVTVNGGTYGSEPPYALRRPTPFRKRNP
jgi:acyl-CoA reductase-like NAD-dependent aldehyde dehydrogenase